MLKKKTEKKTLTTIRKITDMERVAFKHHSLLLAKEKFIQV